MFQKIVFVISTGLSHYDVQELALIQADKMKDRGVKVDFYFRHISSKRNRLG